MKKRTLKTISVIAGAIAAIGLFSFVGGVRSVNLGAAVFPAVIAALVFAAYKKK